MEKEGKRRIHKEERFRGQRQKDRRGRNSDWQRQTARGPDGQTQTEGWKTGSVPRILKSGASDSGRAGAAALGRETPRGEGLEMREAPGSLVCPSPAPLSAFSLGAAPGLGRRAHRRPGEAAVAAREARVRGSRAACVFLLLLFLIKEEFISYLPPARGRGAAIGVNGAEEYKKISLRRIIKVTSWNINRRVTCKKCNITIFTRTAERGKAIKFNIKIFHSLDNLVNKHGIGTTFLLGLRDTSRGLITQR